MQTTPLPHEEIADALETGANHFALGFLETFRILKQLGLDGRLVLTSAHFLALPAIIARTDLAAVMPQAIAHGFIDAERYIGLFKGRP